MYTTNGILAFIAALVRQLIDLITPIAVWISPEWGRIIALFSALLLVVWGARRFRRFRR